MLDFLGVEVPASTWKYGHAALPMVANFSRAFDVRAPKFKYRENAPSIAVRSDFLILCALL
jgi:hypothetical protein